MCGYQDALSNIMPVGWLDPYGNAPFAKDAELSVDITIVETDDGIRAKSVKNPPTSGSSRLMDAIKNALGVGMIDSLDPCSSLQAADQGKCDGMIDKDKKENMAISNAESDKSDTMKSTSSEDSRKQGSQPWSSGKSPGPDATAGKEEDAKGKAPRFK